MARMNLRLAAVFLSAGVLIFAAFSPAENPPATETSGSIPSTAASTEPADVPAIKLKDGKISESFLKMHQSFLDRKSQGPIDLLFLGDSITDFWRRPGPRYGNEIWDQHYAKLNAANFGISGDKLQHVLWRIDNGELDGIHPKVLVLLIGTNNFAYTIDEVDRGEKKLIDEIHRKLPDTKLLIMGIFPRGFDPNSNEPDPKTKVPVALLRTQIKAVNQYLATFDNGGKTRFLDIGEKFLDSDNRIPVYLMPDALHPTDKGYAIWADAMQPLLDEMLK